MLPFLRTTALIFILTAAIPTTIVRAQTKTIQSGWKVLQLPHGWLLNVPKDFKIRKLQGIDTEGGVIRSRKRNISLTYEEFSNWYVIKKDCDTTKAVLEATRIYYQEGQRVIMTSGDDCEGRTDITLRSYDLINGAEILLTEIFSTLRLPHSSLTRDKNLKSLKSVR
ncbi:hypothetical protein GCM10022409_38400 [Hymenobacter glaciei]|uniref:Lipocalin-like domain-containing protein n=1 Tax=Hymenobacter glaciei TaxID=877209 RepID=A0ABP7UNH2_9BACT